MSNSKETVRKILDQVKADKRTSLTAPEGKIVCDAYGIPVPKEGVAKSAADAAKLATEMGFPVVMKIVSPDILHKTEAGGVVVGSGGGTFARYWRIHRPVKIHNLYTHSLYIETLGELGVIGLAILLVALLPPLWVGLHRRAHPLAAPVMAAYIAFLVHTGGDWTWQLPAVGLAAIACGAASIGLVADSGGVLLSGRARVAGIVLAAAVGAVGAWGG